MTIHYLSPGPRDARSGGTRKLYDHVAILSQHGFDVRLRCEVGDIEGEVRDHWGDYSWQDLVVIPEVFNEWLIELAPPGIRRVSFVQNGYLIDYPYIGTRVQPTHAYERCRDLVAIMTESDHTTELVKRYDLPPGMPIYRTHPSGNGREGGDGPFRYGHWPRAKWVMFFNYKNGQTLERLRWGDWQLPAGWSWHEVSGTDQDVADDLHGGAIFLAMNQREGMCAPTSEAMISGALIVGWHGGGAAEYMLPDRCLLAKEGSIFDLRTALRTACEYVDLDWQGCADITRQASDQFQATYSRQAEIDELVSIMKELHG